MINDTWLLAVSIQGACSFFSVADGCWNLLNDGPGMIRRCGPTTDRIRKDIIRIFKQIGFKIEIKTNLKEVDFLDVTFDLRKETY